MPSQFLVSSSQSFVIASGQLPDNTQVVDVSKATDVQDGEVPRATDVQDGEVGNAVTVLAIYYTSSIIAAIIHNTAPSPVLLGTPLVIFTVIAYTSA